MLKRTSARRAATFMAAAGALVMSSGVALMVTATSANADPDPKIVVCKYVGTPGDSTLQGGGNPIEVSINSIKSVVGDDWVANPTFPKAWGDAQGQAGGGSIAIGYAGQGLGISDCPGGGEQQPGAASASATPVQPTCTTAASYTTTVSHATFTSTPAAVAGTTIHLTAAADSGFAFDGGGTTLDVPLTFNAAPTDCPVINPTGGGGGTPPTTTTTSVSPPTVVHHTTHTTHTSTEAATETSAVTPTVVEAGLSSLSTKDMRGEQGLALMVSGMVMLAAAGGLGLRLRGAASRI